MMKRIVIAFLSTISGLVLLMAYPTSTNRTIPLSATGPGTGAGAASSSTTTGGAASGGTAAGGTAPAAGAPPAGGAAPAAAPKSGTFTGGTADTRWGPVQVQIVVSNGKITQASAPVIPNGNGQDAAINSYAIPQLNSEVVQAQNANINMISGATVTSGGYVQSLQDAVNQAFK